MLSLSASAAATVGTIATVANVAAAALSIAASIAAPKGTVGGNATQFKIDKEAGNPVALGRTYSGGNVVHRQYYGVKNSLESWVVAHSIGPVRSLGPLLINNVAVALAGTAITGSYAGYMWLDQQLGACPETRVLQGPQGYFPGWGPNSKLSGIAADLWTLKFDEKMKVYPLQAKRAFPAVGDYTPTYADRQEVTLIHGGGPGVFTLAKSGQGFFLRSDRTLAGILQSIRLVFNRQRFLAGIDSWVEVDFFGPQTG